MPKKILVANRGEIACRIIQSVKKLGFTAVAVYSEADAHARHVRLADESIAIGQARASESYLDADKVVAAARAAGADAIHPGYGFLAENAAFARKCREAGIAFVGPSEETILSMGDKHRAREMAIAASVPVLTGSGKLDPTNEPSILAAGESIGFPVLVKAAGGGGGIGLRPVEDPLKLVSAVQSTSSQAERAFSDPSVYIEKLIRRARHIEVQLFGLGTKGAIHLHHRDCSAQRRYQKILEEARPRRLDPKAAEGMLSSAINLANSVNYQGAGTVEYLYDDETGSFFFMEMNTRLQVEHPVTEMITGTDLVSMQILLALGEDISSTISQESIQDNGHAIEVRVCAERPAKHFVPSPGNIDRMVLPEGEGIRIDTGFEQGDRITPFYDSLMMKIVAHGSDRSQAISRLDAALQGTIIEGIETNLAFLRNLVRHQEFVTDRLHTKFVEDNLSVLI
ncbi:acetyl-CoA carboxylase biotin carboxylase subunit [Chelatococcus asaccharovorans]|uniref:Acetyl-CoA carboxylase biotin carboxylase subunit n=1 Tax=Chelatococcus asaccharovorans TaxID=28210 RepID=A0A2V3TRX5_9HYPH|nr:biotin carboxylase N-terminal domain-containing protein [Chelatococcus asaccharovorans]MBS7707837.1 acetyl-CoA carboxylase biotin carboxylase subunit [Chelatococcus asaccharovorans]PXW50916.1 acetyl-CoA carboxylase biotin carboxylase subunit [Chelatococcus asaccharovorans]